jgi:hypothetical protein
MRTIPPRSDGPGDHFMKRSKSPQVMDGLSMFGDGAGKLESLLHLHRGRLDGNRHFPEPGMFVAPRG